MDSDVDNIDFNNFKGIYFGDKTEKYQDPDTGCHFEYFDLCKRLSNLKQRRKILDKKLGIPTSSQHSPSNQVTKSSKVPDDKRKKQKKRDSQSQSKAIVENETN